MRRYRHATCVEAVSSVVIPLNSKEQRKTLFLFATKKPKMITLSERSSVLDESNVMTPVVKDRKSQRNKSSNMDNIFPSVVPNFDEIYPSNTPY